MGVVSLNHSFFQPGYPDMRRGNFRVGYSTGFNNIMVVIGFLPVVGVPLPLVSSGGSTALATLIQMGVLLSYVRSEPGVKEAAVRLPKYLRSSRAVSVRRNDGTK